MNKGTRIRTALGIAMAFYVAIYKTDLTDFGNNTVNLVYQIIMKIATFVVIFLITYYNNDYSEEACIGTGITRQLKLEKEEGYIGDIFFTDIDEVVEENDEDNESGDDNEQ